MPPAAFAVFITVQADVMIDAGATIAAPAHDATVAILMPAAAKALPINPWGKASAVAISNEPKKMIVTAPITARFTPHRRTASPMGTATRIGIRPYMPVYSPTPVLVIFHALLIWAMTGPKELASIESTEITKRSSPKGSIHARLPTPSSVGADIILLSG